MLHMRDGHQVVGGMKMRWSGGEKLWVALAR